MALSHVFITRPQPQAGELAAEVGTMGLQAVVQPAFTYAPLDIRSAQPQAFADLAAAPAGSLLLFTSPRAVGFGLEQIPPAAWAALRVGAIGPATARVLQAAGRPVCIAADGGYTSEALLESLAADPTLPAPGMAFVVAAPGGRRKLADGLEALGYVVRMLFAYHSQPADLDPDALGSLQSASGLLSVWTSSNAMQALSQRLPPAQWFRLCQGEWLVISERLRRLARAYGPAAVYLAAGPGNDAIVSAVRELLRAAGEPGGKVGKG